MEVICYTQAGNLLPDSERFLMGTLVIRTLHEELHARLKEQAQRHHRSVTKEVVNLLEQGLERRREAAPLPPPLRLKSGRMLSSEEIEDAINDGLE